MTSVVTLMTFVTNSCSRSSIFFVSSCNFHISIGCALVSLRFCYIPCLLGSHPFFLALVILVAQLLHEKRTEILVKLRTHSALICKRDGVIDLGLYVF